LEACDDVGAGDNRVIVLDGAHRMQADPDVWLAPALASGLMVPCGKTQMRASIGALPVAKENAGDKRHEVA
jgi:hypothetical protein